MQGVQDPKKVDNYLFKVIILIDCSILLRETLPGAV